MRNPLPPGVHVASEVGRTGHTIAPTGGEVTAGHLDTRDMQAVWVISANRWENPDRVPLIDTVATLSEALCVAIQTRQSAFLGLRQALAAVDPRSFTTPTSLALAVNTPHRAEHLVIGDCTLRVPSILRPPLTGHRYAGVEEELLDAALRAREDLGIPLSDCYDTTADLLSRRAETRNTPGGVWAIGPVPGTADASDAAEQIVRHAVLRTSTPRSVLLTNRVFDRAMQGVTTAEELACQHDPLPAVNRVMDARQLLRPHLQVIPGGDTAAAAWIRPAL